MSKFLLEKVSENEFNIKMEEGDLLNLELKPIDLELYKDSEKYFFLKLRKTVFNFKMNKLIGLLESEFIKLINDNCYYFNSYINFEKIYKNVDGNIILKIHKGNKDINEIFYKDTKKIILKFDKLIVEEDLSISLVKVIINYDIEKSKNLPILSEFIFEN
jgi:hypothetical protein